MTARLAARKSAVFVVVEIRTQLKKVKRSFLISLFRFQRNRSIKTSDL